LGTSGNGLDEDGWPTLGRYINRHQIAEIETLPTAA
jgi:hypothetical protein